MPERLPPGHPDAPKFWTYETSGVLRPVIEAYLHDRNLSDGQIRIMRAYLQQWFRSPVWAPCFQLEALRRQVDAIKTKADIRSCLNSAAALMIDPL